jgi:hypothetical protein
LQKTINPRQLSKGVQECFLLLLVPNLFLKSK